MELIEYWAACSLDGEHYVHPADIAYHAQLKKYGFADNLIPVPYMGNIGDSKIVIAMINPGQKTGEISEYNFESMPAMQRALRSNLYQDLGNHDYPFMYLNPEFSFHPGYTYWFSRFKKGMEEYAAKHSCSLGDAQQVYARSVAILELVPYHSVDYRGAIHLSLPSSQHARRAFHILSRNRLMIVPRKHRDWGLSKPSPGDVHQEGNVVSYFNRKACFGDKIRRLIIEYLN